MRVLLTMSILMAAVDGLGSQKFKIGKHAPASFKEPSPNLPAAHVLVLTRKSGGSKSAGYLKSLRKGDAVNGVYGVAPIATAEEGQTFLVRRNFGYSSRAAGTNTGLVPSGKRGIWNAFLQCCD